MHVGTSRHLLFLFISRCNTRLTIRCPFVAAWRVDFNLTLPSFESYVADLRRLVNFALSCRLPTPPRFLFVSSVAAVSRSEDRMPVPEHAAPAEAAVGTGYGESKWVAEALLIEAATRTPLRVVIVRTGQVSGGINGYWNSSEWFPSMIQSASSVKCLPVTASERVSIRHSCIRVARRAVADSGYLTDRVIRAP